MFMGLFFGLLNRVKKIYSDIWHTIFLAFWVWRLHYLQRVSKRLANSQACMQWLHFFKSSVVFCLSKGYATFLNYSFYDCGLIIRISDLNLTQLTVLAKHILAYWPVYLSLPMELCFRVKSLTVYLQKRWMAKNTVSFYNHDKMDWLASICPAVIVDIRFSCTKLTRIESWSG